MTTRVSIVGSGFGLYGLLPAFKRVEGCEVISICGERSERLLSDCKKAGINKIYSDSKGMLRTEKPDAVAIAVIPRYQYGIAKHSLDNGIAVFAEKPLTTDASDSLELYKLAKKNSLPNMVDFIYPEIPEWVEAKKALASGMIGKVLQVQVEWKFLSYDLKNKVRSWKTDVHEGGGALFFYFPHMLYYLEFFMGKIKNLECVFSTSKKSLNRGETAIEMVVLFESGCIGRVNLDHAYTGQPKHAIKFHGEDGTLLLDNHSNSWVDNFELTAVTQQGTKRIKSDRLPPPDTSEDQRVRLVRKIATRFIRWCNTGIASKPDFQDGFRVQKLIEMARASDSRFRK